MFVLDLAGIELDRYFREIERETYVYLSLIVEMIDEIMYVGLLRSIAIQKKNER